MKDNKIVPLTPSSNPKQESKTSVSSDHVMTQKSEKPFIIKPLAVPLERAVKQAEKAKAPVTEPKATGVKESDASEKPSEAIVPSWEELGISAGTIELLLKAGLSAPRAVQIEAIPVALSGGDLAASAQTGTGKTAAFVLPMIEKLRGKEGTLGLILAPTREVAQQIQVVFDQFGTPQGVRSIVLIGGVDMRYDTAAIATYPQVIVATPGRLCDHLDRGNIWLDFMQWVVLDEADRMLDMGFSSQLDRIMKDIPDTAQTMVFSATIPPSVERLARGILKDPKFVSAGVSNSAASTVEQKIVWMWEESKNRQLLRLLREETGTIIVFTRSKDSASRLYRSLHSRNVSDAAVIHSDLRQMDREKALAGFKDGTHRVLIATDIAGRGIHVDAVAHVVNYDLPREPEDYIHRIGRTGRSNALGKATSFATPRDRLIVAEIEKLVREKIPSEFADRLDEPRPESASGSPGRHSSKRRTSGRR